MKVRFEDVSLEKLIADIESEDPRFVGHGGIVAERLINLADHVPDTFSDSTDSGSHIYDWWHEQVCEISEDVLGIDLMDVCSDLEDNFYDVTFRIADTFDTLSNMPMKRIIELAGLAK